MIFGKKFLGALIKHVDLVKTQTVASKQLTEKLESAFEFEPSDSIESEIEQQTELTMIPKTKFDLALEVARLSSQSLDLVLARRVRFYG